MKAVRDRSAGFHAAIRDWIESLLPKSKAALDAEFTFLTTRVQAELERSTLLNAADMEHAVKPGTLDHVRLSRPLQDSEKLVVTVGVDVPCGFDDAVYVYDYSHGEPRRVMESQSPRDYAESISDVLLFQTRCRWQPSHIDAALWSTVRFELE